MGNLRAFKRRMNIRNVHVAEEVARRRKENIQAKQLVDEAIVGGDDTYKMVSIPTDGGEPILVNEADVPGYLKDGENS